MGAIRPYPAAPRPTVSLLAAGAGLAAAVVAGVLLFARLGAGYELLAAALGLPLDVGGFVVPEDEALSPVESGREGVCIAGAAAHPMNPKEAALQGRAAAWKAYLTLGRRM